MTMLTAVPDRPELVPELSLDELKALSDAEVADSLTVWAGRMAAGEARLLAFLGEFDAREQWAGFPSCASWLSWRLGIGPKTAAEKVRVAQALRLLPLSRATFERGELSYTQVRAFTRFASADNESELLPLVRSCSGEQIERLGRGISRAKAADDPDHVEQARHGVTVSYDYDGTFVLTARLPAEQGAIVLAALETCQEQLELAAREPSAETSATAPKASRPRVSRQQALLQVAQDWLDSQSESVRRRSKPRLTAHLDPLSGWARLHNGELLPPAVAKTLSLTQFDKGRAQREVDLRLRQLLGAVDGERCRFPGCRHTRHLKAHHVIWWSRGGRTDLANLILVCGRHHQLIHDEQITISLHPDRTLTVRAADGTLLPARPDLPVASAEDLDPQGQITPDTSPNPWAADRLNLGYAVSVLMHLAA
jgi:hypothetical protein